jgi:hypothetical protein
MVTKDEEIFKIYSSVEKICFEINDLFIAINQLMNKRKYISFSALRWDITKSLGSPAMWLPYFSQGMYKKENNNRRAIGINLLIKDPNCKNVIPFITVGIIKSNKDIPGGSDVFYGAGWHEEYKLEKLGKSVFSLTISKKEQVEILSYFIRLTAVDTIINAVKLITSPLDKMYNFMDSDWKDLNKLEEITGGFQKDTLTVEQIRGDCLPLE